MLRLLMAVTCLVLISINEGLIAQTGIVDYVPNGSFEHNSKPDNQLGVYNVRFGKYSLFWRQFHRWTVPNEVGTLPDWPIEADLIHSLVMYEPVTCSSSDLFSQHLPDCIPGNPGSLYDIPNNNFGFEPIRLGSTGQKYAGLYYRLNGIRPKAGGGYEAFQGNAATDWWREYLEVELLCPLVEGRVYNLSFWASLGEVSEKNVKIEARVSQQPYHTHPLDDCDIVTDFDANQTSAVRAPVTDGLPGYSLMSGFLPKNGVLPNRGWVKVEGTFTAAGGEKYLTIGYFGDVVQNLVTTPDDCMPHYAHVPLTTQRVYVYIDDVRLKTTEEIPCNCNGVFQLVPIPPSLEQPDKCCFTVLFENNGDGVGPACNSCSIYSIIGRKSGSQDIVLDWVSTSRHGPIGGDGIPRELGIICVDEFYYQPKATFEFELRGENNELLCQESTEAFGCVDECNCFDFMNSVSITPISSGGNPCCYRVKLDATILSGCAQIASISVFKKSQSVLTEIPSAAYNTPVATTFSGYLYTFCPTPPVSFASGDKVVMIFKDASGDPICEIEMDPLNCVCDCNSSSAEIRYQAVTGPNNSCCYDVIVRNSGACKISFSSVWIKGADFQSLSLSGSNGWTSSLSYAGGTPNGAIFSKSGTPSSLYPDQELVVGRVCPGDCFVGDLSSKSATITYTVNGIACNARPVYSSASESCSNEIDCDDFIVSITANPVWNSQCCWYGVSAKVDVCPAEYLGLYVEVAGFPQQPVISSNNTLISAWTCLPNTGGITIKLKRADGTVLCTKSIGIPSCNSANNLSGTPENPNVNESSWFFMNEGEIHSIAVKKHSRLEDEAINETLDAWVVFSLDGTVMASSEQVDSKVKDVKEVVGTLPLGVYVIRCSDTKTGRSIVRRVYVQP